MAVGAAYSLGFLIFQVMRTYFWWRYRPFSLPPGPLPKVTVIIPAYNEGAMVEKAIYSVAASDYPADRLEIFCIDDGSKDDTWEYMQRAQARCPELIRLIRFPKNRGKREALYAGFTQGTGDYFVSVDSDSVIEAGTIKQIVAPMLQDPKIGGVAGNVKVYNRFANLITRMLWVRFVLSFDFLRASQSGYGFVFCTPGALSAYRREAIMPILEEWRGQTFLGTRCTIGEDRAFTNLILRQGSRDRLSAQRRGLHHRARDLQRHVPDVPALGPVQFPGVLYPALLHVQTLPAEAPPAAHRGLLGPGVGVSPRLSLYPPAPGLHLPLSPGAAEVCHGSGSGFFYP